MVKNSTPHTQVEKNTQKQATTDRPGNLQTAGCGEGTE